MLYMYKKTPEAILLVNFGLFAENFVTSYLCYLAQNKSAEIMEEVCEVDPKILRKIFCVQELFLARNVSCYIPV